MAAWMKTLVVIIFLSAIMQSIDAQSSVVGKVGKESTENLGLCECAVFSSENITKDQKPLIKNNPLNITCPADDTCMKMCVALATAAKAKGPGLLCAQIDDVDNLYLSLFIRTCDDTEWKYTGLTCHKPICCHNKKPTPCKENPVVEEQHTVEKLNTIEEQHTATNSSVKE